MSNAVKLSSRLPGEPDVNGVDHLADQLVKEPEQIRVAVLWFDVQKVTHDTDTSNDVPTIRVRRIEEIGALGDIPKSLQTLIDRRIETRTGRAPLPFDTVEVIE